LSPHDARRPQAPALAALQHHGRAAAQDDRARLCLGGGPDHLAKSPDRHDQAPPEGNGQPLPVHRDVLLAGEVFQPRRLCAPATGVAVSLLDAAIAVVSLAACSLGPGLIIVRRLRWRPLEALCASVGLSWVIVYLVAGTIYAADLTPRLAFVSPLIGVIGLIVSRRELGRLWRHPLTR